MDELGEAREVYLFLYNSLPDIIRKQCKKNDDSEYIQHYSIIPLIINILLQKVSWIKEEYPVKHNDPFKYGYDNPLYRLIINNIHDLVHASTKIEAGLVTIKLPKDKYIEEEIFDEEINRMNLEQQKDDGKVTRKFIYVKQGIDNNEIINEDWDDINDGIVGIDNVKKGML